MQWKDEYATGIQKIDEQHKMLFKMSHDYRLALDEGGGEKTYESFLSSLSAFCSNHFRFEEKCMEEYRCPAAHENKEAHAMFLATLGNYRQRYATSGYLATDAQKLVHTIDRWLDEHILGVDVQLRSYVKK